MSYNPRYRPKRGVYCCFLKNLSAPTSHINKGCVCLMQQSWQILCSVSVWLKWAEWWSLILRVYLLYILESRHAVLVLWSHITRSDVCLDIVVYLMEAIGLFDSYDREDYWNYWLLSHNQSACSSLSPGPVRYLNPGCWTVLQSSVMSNITARRQ